MSLKKGTDLPLPLPLHVIYFCTYFYLMSKHCLPLSTAQGNGSWNFDMHKKREPHICFLRAEFHNITNPLGGFPVPSGVPSNLRVLVMKLCRACCHISLLPSWRLMTWLINVRVAVYLCGSSGIDTVATRQCADL